MKFLQLNFMLGIFLFLTSGIIRKKKTEKEKKQQELELERSCEELEESLSYFIVRPGLAKDLNAILKNKYNMRLIRLILMQIPALNIIFFVRLILDRIKEFKGDKK